MQKCFFVNNLNQALELFDITFDKYNNKVRAIDKEAHIVICDAKDVIIINDEMELNIFMKEYEVV